MIGGMLQRRVCNEETIPNTVVCKQSVMLAKHEYYVSISPSRCPETVMPLYKTLLGEDHTLKSSLLFLPTLSPASRSQLTCCYPQ